MRFGVLGPLAVWTGDGRPVPVPEPKVRTLLACLLVEPGRVVSADRLAQDLWGERQPRDPANSLQTKVSQLRRALEGAEPGGRSLVFHQPPGYLLRVEPGSVDAQRFRDLAARAAVAADPAQRAALLAEALGLWRGPALAGFADEPFAVATARRLDEERVVAQEAWLQARLDLGEHAAVLGELTDLVARHPLREGLRALHMRALYRSGRQSEALASYADLRRRLADEQGLDPSPELAALQRAILDHSLDPAPRAAAPHGPVPRGPALLDPPPRERSNLPAALTELVGRDRAIAAVRDRIGESRLVTLTGPGGVGKTSLALAAARDTEDAWLVELAQLPVGARDDQVVAVLAATTGIRAATAERLAAALGERRVLLVLDNCEHVVDPVARVAARLLRAAPQLRVLATSREPLGVEGEVLWHVPPLEVPGAEALRSADAGVLARFPAVRMFVARATAAVPGFVLDAGNARTVATICSRLDGIPLALELAAAKLRALGPEELLRRLDDRFRLLTTGRRDAPVRQRTLRAVIDWSWELLSDTERTVLRRLAVTTGGCSLAAAEALCAPDGLASADVLDAISCLVDRSLVVAVPGPAGEPRYRLLESVAAYGRERAAEAGELAGLRRRHLDHHLASAERSASGLRGAAQRMWLDRLDADAANLRAALDTAVERGAAEPALRLVLALTWYWFLRGRLAEGIRALKTALDLPGGPAARRGAAAAWLAGFGALAGGPSAVDPAVLDEIPDPALRDEAAWFLGYVLTTLGDMPAARRLTERALAGFRSRGDLWGTAAATTDLLTQRMGQGDLPHPREAEQCMREFTALGDRWGELQAAFVRGNLAEIAGDYATATALFERGVRTAEGLGLWPEVSYQLSWLGRIALLVGDAPRCRDLHERAMRVAVEHGFKAGEVFAETGLALLARRTGRLDDAERHLRSVRSWHDRDGFEAASTLIRAELGFVAELRGDAAAAEDLHRSGLELARRLGDPRAVALGLEGLAGAAALAGDHVRAARLLGAAARTRESVGSPLPPAERGDVDRITAAVTAALGAERFAQEYARDPEEAAAVAE
ncbi:BTAD domain-containing putative transcriptional regulator [Pseudonocardia thermophila]|uniref:BTAD domain-containing putative transcriptional regulator n=1 Tax=Pseudonocardia thermophila TaxID=1848 RepID=UPI0009371D19|nr:BTAD domain-containing putative transcriptional regulator [Pseudonocardia thermophila]